jgi:D-alanine-D-alanine ligase
MKVAVLLGGISQERNVSIAGGIAVLEAMKELGYEAIAVDPAYGADGIRNQDELTIVKTPPTKEELSQFSPKSYLECVNSEIFDDVEVAFNVLHGTYGEDGRMQSLLELRGIPCTGSNSKANAIGMDKFISKMLFTVSQIPTPPGDIMDNSLLGDYDYYEELRALYQGQLVIKPNDQGSTVGTSIILDGNLDDIHTAFEAALKFSKAIIVERFIPGREITVGIIGGQALPIVEIVPTSGFYDYEAKYAGGQSEYICPADLPEDVIEFTQNMALSAYTALDCSGFARVDFRLTEEFQPFILEVNTIPGFTATSLVPMAAKATGQEFPELCKEIIELAMKKEL